MPQCSASKAYLPQPAITSAHQHPERAPTTRTRSTRMSARPPPGRAVRHARVRRHGGLQGAPWRGSVDARAAVRTVEAAWGASAPSGAGLSGMRAVFRGIYGKGA